MNVDVYDLINIYENEVSKNTKNKRKVNIFERNKIQNIYNIKNIIESGNYKVGRYNIFSINKPKYRIVMSLNISDKIINHYVTRNILIKKLDKYLDIRNVATRKNMGYDYGIKLLLKYLNKFKNSKFYILKIDISKYFYSIDHIILKSLLIDKLDKNEYKIISNIIDSTNNDYINKEVIKIKERLINIDKNRLDEIKSIPNIEKGKSLPIGNMTSQFLSIFYLYKLDYFIIHNLKLKYMVKYMDDYIILSKDKKCLKHCLEVIKEKLKIEYKLNINDKKTFIIDSIHGFDFLGYNFKIINNKIIINIKGENKKRKNNNIKKLNYLYKNNLISYRRYFNSINNYNNSYKYSKKH